MRSKQGTPTRPASGAVRKVMIKAFRAQMPVELEYVGREQRPIVITKNGKDKAALVPLNYLEAMSKLSEMASMGQILEKSNDSEEIVSGINSYFRTSFFKTEYPPEYGGRLNSASELCLIGTTLRRIIPKFRRQLETVILSGGKIKAILVDPKNRNALRYAMMHTFFGRTITEQGIDDYSEYIWKSYRDLAELKKLRPENVSLYKIDNPLSCGIDLIDKHSDKGVIYVRQFQLETEDLPIFEITPEDAYWFRFYCDLVDHHINAATSWE